MFSISYISYLLIIVLLINRDFASYFYPYILITSVLGIAFNTMSFIFPSLKMYYERFFTRYHLELAKKMTSKYKLHGPTIELIHDFTIIFMKLLLLYIWPKNMTPTAFRYTGYLILLYFVILFCYMVFQQDLVVPVEYPNRLLERDSSV